MHKHGPFFVIVRKNIPPVFFIFFYFLFAVLMDAVVFFYCSHLAPCFASLSAYLFPGMFVLPGIHCKVMLMVWAIMTLLIFQFSDCHVLDVLNSSASRPDLVTRKMTILLHCFTFCVNVFDMLGRDTLLPLLPLHSWSCDSTRFKEIFKHLIKEL